MLVVWDHSLSCFDIVQISYYCLFTFQQITIKVRQKSYRDYPVSWLNFSYLYNFLAVRSFPSACYVCIIVYAHSIRTCIIVYAPLIHIRTRTMYSIGLATKWLRILSLGGIDKIRIHFVANPILYLDEFQRIGHRLEFSDGWLKKIVYLIHGVLNSCKASNIFLVKIL